MGHYQEVSDKSNKNNGLYRDTRRYYGRPSPANSYQNTIILVSRASFAEASYSGRRAVPCSCRRIQVVLLRLMLAATLPLGICCADLRLLTPSPSWLRVPVTRTSLPGSVPGDSSCL